MTDVKKAETIANTATDTATDTATAELRMSPNIPFSQLVTTPLFDPALSQAENEFSLQCLQDYVEQHLHPSLSFSVINIPPTPEAYQAVGLQGYIQRVTGVS